MFGAYGHYLSSRGDLLTPADRRCLAAIGREVSPVPPSVIRAIVRAETGRSRVQAGCSAYADGAIAALDAEPFDTRLLIQRHYGRLTSGAEVVVRVVRPERSNDSDVELIPLLRNAVAPLLSDARLFPQSVDDFRASYLAETNGHALADALEILGHDAQSFDSLRIPKVHREISTPRVLVLERLAGRRLERPGAGDSQPTAASAEDDDETRRSSCAGDGPARLLCELWLRQAFDSGLVPTDLRPENLIVLSRSQLAVDEGTFAVLPHETRQNLLKYLVAVAIDEPRRALDWLLKEFEAGRHRSTLDQLDRFFRQMIPDAVQDDLSEGPTSDLASTVQAQWRLAIENGYRPLRHGLPVLRGIVRVNETVQALAPGTDALLDGLKDYRLTRLLGDVHAMFEPMYWFARIDRIANVMISSPRILDDALAAAVPDRADADRRAPGPRGRRARLETWLVPALVALASVGLTHGRGPPGTGGTWDESLAAVLFLLLGCWLLRIAGDSDR